MKRLIYFALLILTLSVVVACTSDSQDETEIPATDEPAVETTTWSISGSGSVTPIIGAIASAFEAANPEYIIEVLPGSGTSGGIRGVMDGTLDLVAMSRPARDTEEGIEFAQFGTSATAIMAHPEIGVTELTSEQLTGIFQGEITNWSEIGGNDLEIALYIRDAEEGNTVDIRETYIGDGDFAESAQTMTSQTDMQNVLSTVAGSIGYGTWATAIANDADIISLTIDGISADNPSDTLITLMGVGYLADRADEFQPLLDWLLSEEGQTALTNLNVTPVVAE